MKESAAKEQLPEAGQGNHTALFPPGYNLERKERDGGWITYTVRREGIHVGSLRVIRYVDSHSYWLSRLYVKKAHRHQGIGRALILLALEQCRPWRVAGFIQPVGRNRVGLARLRRFYTLCGAQIDEGDVISWPATTSAGEQGN